RDLGARPRVGRARALLARLARRRHDPARRRRDRTAPTKSRHRPARLLDRGGDRSLGSHPSGATPGRFHPDAGTPPLESATRSSEIGEAKDGTQLLPPVLLLAVDKSLNLAL